MPPISHTLIGIHITQSPTQKHLSESQKYISEIRSQVIIMMSRTGLCDLWPLIYSWGQNIPGVFIILLWKRRIKNNCLYNMWLSLLSALLHYSITPTVLVRVDNLDDTNADHNSVVKKHNISSWKGNSFSWYTYRSVCYLNTNHYQTLCDTLYIIAVNKWDHDVDDWLSESCTSNSAAVNVSLNYFLKTNKL